MPITRYPAATYQPPDAFTTGEATFDRRNCAMISTQTTVTQQLWLSYFTARRTETINTISIFVGSTGAAATPTLIRYGIYSVDASSNLTLVASTPNDTTLLATPSVASTKALSAAWNKVEATRYALGFLIVTAVTVPTLVTPVTTSANAPIATVLGDAPRCVGFLTGQSDLPTTATESAISANTATRPFYARFY